MLEQTENGAESPNYDGKEIEERQSCSAILTIIATHTWRDKPFLHLVTLIPGMFG
jgi:hypothetical protein